MRENMQGHDGPFYLGICLIITNYPIKSVTCRDGRVNTCVRKPGKTRVGALAAVILSKPHSNSGPFSLNMALTFFLTLSQTSPGFYVSAVQVFERTAGKGEIAHNEQFSFSHIIFYPFGEVTSTLKLSSANSLSLEECKICHLGKG